MENSNDVNVTDHSSYTPLHDASEEGSLQAVQMLLKHGAKTDIKNKVSVIHTLYVNAGAVMIIFSISCMSSSSCVVRVVIVACVLYRTIKLLTMWLWRVVTRTSQLSYATTQ